MPEGSSILAFLGSIKTAKETLSLILNAPKALEKAEFQLKIASLTKTLTELEEQARDFEEVIREKDEEIERLKTLLEKKNNISFDTLPKQCIEVLKFLGQHDELSPIELSQSPGNEEIGKVDYFLDKLKQQNFVSYYGLRDELIYSLTEKGREILYEKIV